MTETTVERPFSPTFGEDGEPCAECRSPLARDQRYCLECGHRRAEARIPFLDVLREEYGGGHRPVEEAPVEEPPRRRSGLSPLAAAGTGIAVGLLLIAAVLVGLLAERSSEDKTAAAPAPQVIQVPAAAAQPVAAQALVDDWPSGQEGWTVQLQALPKETTQTPTVAQAKQAATAKGATEVGALDSDHFSSLDAGEYVVYSGVFDNQKDAKAAFKKLHANFPEAKVVQVSASGNSSVSNTGGDKNVLSGKKKKSGTVDKSQLQRLQNLSPGEYQKQSRKLPDETKLPGKPPKQDGKQPGGGSGAQTIG